MLRRPLALLTFCALTFSACGDDEPDAADATVEPATTTSTTTVVAAGTGGTTDSSPPSSPAPATDPPATDPPATEPPPTEPPPTDPPAGTDPCLVGTWELQSQRFFDELIAQSPEAFPGTVTHVGGRQFIEFSGDGTARGGREQWSFVTEGPQGNVYVTLDAIDEGTYSVVGERLDLEQTTVGEVDLTIEMEQGGVRVPMPMPMGGPMPGEQAAAASGPYTCDGDVFTLTITEGAITLTNVWDRVPG